MLTYTTQRVWTPEQLYPNGYNIPNDYEFVDFRPVKKGDVYLWSPTDHIGHIALIDSPYDPRIIIRPSPKRKVYTFRAIEKRRVPLKGEWYRLDGEGSFYKATAGHFAPQYIYELIESEE